MTSLIRNQSHNNRIITLYLPNIKVIRKISYHSSGILKIKKEFEGLNWYQKKRKYKLISNLEINKKSAVIDINLIDGRIVDYNEPITKTKKYLINIVDHYKKIWGSNKKYSPSHGDLTLDNIIINKENIHIIDWEHFETSGKNYGFDVAYLIFSALILPNKGSFPKNEEIKVASKLWHYIFKKNCIDKNCYLNPIKFFEKNITKKWLKKNKISWSKIIFSLMSKHKLYEIQNKVLNELK